MNNLINTSLLTLTIAACSSGPHVSETPAENSTNGAVLQITANISENNRQAAVAVYKKYRTPFLEKADGARSKTLLIREDDVQILHTFDSQDQAAAYLSSQLFTKDVLSELGPLLTGDPDIRNYEVLPVETSTAVAGAFLEITLEVDRTNRSAAAEVFHTYRQPFLTSIVGAVSKDLVIRTEDVQVLHGFTTKAAAEVYLNSALFTNDVVVALTPYLQSNPEVRIYEVLP